MQSFTRNYQDNGTDAGFQFTFFCDICNDGYRSSFMESETYKKRAGSRLLGQGADMVGNLLGGRMRDLGWAAQRGSDILSDKFQGQSPEWRREHDRAFELAQNEAKDHFHRCPSCAQYGCDQCWNEDEGLCTKCAPRQEVYVARAKADAMRRNIDQAGASATVWQGNIESKTTMCPNCGKPAGSGKFCNNCGTSMELKACPTCGAANAQAVRFCNNCGTNLTAAPANLTCGGCGAEHAPGTRFCGNCGTALG